MAFGFGAALYFSLFSEPNIYLILVLLIIGIMGFFIKKPILFPLVSLFIGFGYAGVYTHIKNTPILSYSQHGIQISGNVHDIDYNNGHMRLTVETKEYGTVHVTDKSGKDIVNIGDTISGKGGLFKPAPANMPETFDAARWAYFNGISANGYISKIQIKNHKSSLDGIRQYVHRQAKSTLSDSLILGYKNTISKQEKQIWATNGVAHLWSISGYHLALVGGWLLFLFYIIFRLCPPIVRRIPARIPATICAWFGLLGYLVISGGAIATQRAFLMTSCVMAAFMFGREAFSLRTVGLTFLLLLLVNPYFIMTAGFQLSFSAVFGIVWLWTVAKPRLPQNKPLAYIWTALLTALVASVFTLPFVIAHFNSLPVYTILANLIMVPVFSFVVMPLVLLGTILSVFNLHLLLHFADKIYDLIFIVANWICTLPYANINPHNIPNSALVVLIFGLGCIIFIKSDSKIKYFVIRHLNFFAGALFICIGLLMWTLQPKPVFYITPDHYLFATVKNNELHFNKEKDSNNYFAFDTWKKSNGEKIGTSNKKFAAESGVHTIQRTNWTLVYIQRFVPLSRNIKNLCQSNDVKFIASFYDIKSKYCDKKIIKGGAVIYETGHIDKVPFNRWWHNRHE